MKAGAVRAGRGGNYPLVLFVAALLDLDVDRFVRDFESPDRIEKVENDFESGVRSGVNGTPAFYINGEKYN